MKSYKNIVELLELLKLKGMLKSLDENMTDDDANSIAERQQDEPFEDIQAFKTYMEKDRNKKDFSTAGMAVASDYFLLTSDTRIGRGKVILYSIFQFPRKHK